MNYRGIAFWPIAAALIAFASWVGKALEGDDND